MGGAEKQLVTLIKEQVKSGRKVSVVYLKGIPELENEVIDSGSDLVSSLANLNPLIQIFLLRKHLSKNEDAIIHAHLPRAELLSVFLPKKYDFIISRHNAEQFFPKAPRFFSRILSLIVTRRASKVIAISQAVREFLFDSGELSTSANISVIHYGFGESTSKGPASNSRIEQLMHTNFLIGTIARLVPQKDLKTLIEAFALFVPQNKLAKLVIVGDGYLKEELIAYSAHLGVSEDIIWFGRTESISEIIRTMDVFALTSKYEGFGLVLLEAMLEDVAILAPRNSAIPEVLGKDYEGLFQTGDAKMLAELFTLTTDPKVSQRMRLYLAKRLKKFEPHRMRKEIDDAYSSLETL
jgi:glycosyltransferase involved in cell wall biosynthesis